MSPTTYLATLHPELLTIILEYVVEGSVKPFPTLNVVCSQFNNVVKALVKRHITLEFRHETLKATYDMMSKMLKDDLMLLNIRGLTITGGFVEDRRTTIIGRYTNEEDTDDDSSDEADESNEEDTTDDDEENDDDDDDDDDGRTALMLERRDPLYKTMRRKEYFIKIWRLLTKLITKIPKLKTLEYSFEGPLPKSIIQALQDHQRDSKLKIHNWTWRRGCYHKGNPESALALATCRNLIHIRAVIYTSEPDHLHEAPLATLLRLTMEAPCLEHISIIREHQTTGLAWGRKRTFEEEFGTDFDVSRRSNSVRSLTLDGFSDSNKALGLVEKYIDLSRIERFKFSRQSVDASFFHVVLFKFPGLKHFSFNFGPKFGRLGMSVADQRIAQAAFVLLNSGNLLESLSLWSWRGSVDLNSILRHGPTLLSLQLHEREGYSAVDDRWCLHSKELGLIRQACGKLREVTFDLHRESEEGGMHDTTNCAIYEELAQFGPRLQRVQIYFNLNPLRTSTIGGNDYAPPIPLPSTTNKMLSYLHNVWKAIFGDHASASQQLEVKFGEWERKIGDRVTDQISRERSERRYYKVHPSERDDQLGEIVVRMFGGGHDGILLQASDDPVCKQPDRVGGDHGNLDARDSAEMRRAVADRIFATTRIS